MQIGMTGANMAYFEPAGSSSYRSYALGRGPTMQRERIDGPLLRYLARAAWRHCLGRVDACSGKRLNFSIASQLEGNRTGSPS